MLPRALARPRGTGGARAVLAVLLSLTVGLFLFVPLPGPGDADGPHSATPGTAQRAAISLPEPRGCDFDPAGAPLPAVGRGPVDLYLGLLADLAARGPGPAGSGPEADFLRQGLLDRYRGELSATPAPRARAGAAQVRGGGGRPPPPPLPPVPALAALVDDLHRDNERARALGLPGAGGGAGASAGAGGLPARLPTVGIVTVTAAGAADLGPLLVWMAYHLRLGASRFYVFYDGPDPAALEALGALACADVTPVRPGLGAAAEEFVRRDLPAKARRWPQWAGLPGNAELVLKQLGAVDRALGAARAGGVEWLLHLDGDEMVAGLEGAGWAARHPGGDGSPALPPAAAAGEADGGEDPRWMLPRALGSVPAAFPAARFLNAEAQATRGDGAPHRRFSPALFRANREHTPAGARAARPGLALGDSAGFLQLYANGKSAARTDAPGVSEFGPHFFTGRASRRWATARNPGGGFETYTHGGYVVLHYPYQSPADVAAKARVSCPPGGGVDPGGAAPGAAAPGGVGAGGAGPPVLWEGWERCFFLEADRAAFEAAARGGEAARRLWWSRHALVPGSWVACPGPAAPGGPPPGAGDVCPIPDVARHVAVLRAAGMYFVHGGVRRVLRELGLEPGGAAAFNTPRG